VKLKAKSKAETSTESIVLLNSGGFDSVVLAHEVNFLHSAATVHNLFFDYHQLCVKSERKCSKSCADKLGFKYVEMTLPDFNWCDSVLTGGDSESQYIPLRNLVFLSYAMSYAQSVGATKVYCAFINPNGEYYPDTSPQFVEQLNTLSLSLGVEIVAPFVDQTKDILLKSLARTYGIYPQDVHSCNFGDEPCGECPDCVALEEIFEDVVIHTAEDLLIDSKFSPTPEMVKSIKESHVTNVKVYINNDCQFQCKHCFIGKTELVDEPLEAMEWSRLFKELVAAGVKRVDFFGKEPLYDEKIFPYLSECKGLGLQTSLITNGVNVSKYISRLEETMPEITLSVESLSKDTDYRNGGKHLTDTIKLLVSRGFTTKVSIDLSDANFNGLKDLVKKLSKLGVSEIYVKPLRPFGEAEEYLMAKMLHPRNILQAVDDLIEVAPKVNVPITLSLSAMDLSRTQEADPKKFNDVLGYAIQNRLDCVDGIFLELELFCHRFKDSVAITPDGYVLGCASEYVTDYSHYPNIRDMDFQRCVQKGKETLTLKTYDCVGCYFCKEYKKIAKIFAI